MTPLAKYLMEQRVKAHAMGFVRTIHGMKRFVEDNNMKPQKKRMLKYEHEKEMPGSPLITEVFGNAWSKIYGHGELAGVWFEFNGMTVTIKRSITGVIEAMPYAAVCSAAANLVRSMKKCPSEYGDHDVEIKALKRALRKVKEAA